MSECVCQAQHTASTEHARGFSTTERTPSGQGLQQDLLAGPAGCPCFSQGPTQHLQPMWKVALESSVTRLPCALEADSPGRCETLSTTCMYVCVCGKCTGIF